MRELSLCRFPLIRCTRSFPCIALGWHWQVYRSSTPFDTQTVRSHSHPVWLQIIPPLQLAVAAFVFVLNMRRASFDLELLYTASAPLGFGLGGTAMVRVLCVTPVFCDKENTV
jgi:hypothetical protein